MARTGQITRHTSETQIEVRVNLDDAAGSSVQTPIPFLTHMVEQIVRHGAFGLVVEANGDVEIDGHHTTEDLGIAIGSAFKEALGDKAGIRRYGWATLPMDEARLTCALDLSGRTFFVYDVEMPKAKVGTFDTELAEVFFEGFARGSESNLHLDLHAGSNLHHIIEISFKAFAKALRMATELDPRAHGVPSTKGTLAG